MKAIHIELPDEAVHLIVPKVTRQHYLLEFSHIPYHKLETGGRPVYYLGELVILNGYIVTRRI